MDNASNVENSFFPHFCPQNHKNCNSNSAGLLWGALNGLKLREGENSAARIVGFEDYFTKAAAGNEAHVT